MERTVCCMSEVIEKVREINAEFVAFHWNPSVLISVLSRSFRCHGSPETVSNVYTSRLKHINILRAEDPNHNAILQAAGIFRACAIADDSRCASSRSGGVLVMF